MDLFRIDALEIETTRYLHDQLGEYWRTQHCSLNYEEVISEWVAELLEEIRCVPLNEPLVIPTDPFKRLFSLIGTDKLEPYDPVLYTTKAAAALVIRVQKDTQGKIRKSERVGLDAGESYAPIANPFPTTDMMLTARARRHTAALGKGNYKEAFPVRFSSLRATHCLPPAKVEEAPEPQLSFDILTNVNDLRVDPSQIRPLLDPLVKIQKCDSKFDDQSYIDRFEQEIDAYIDIPGTWPSIMFPRNCLPGHCTAPPAAGPQTLDTILAIVHPQASIPSSDDDVPGQSMRMVDGWQTICSSSPPSPVSHSSEDAIDQLCFPSTPDTDPPLAEEIQLSKLDVPLFPRSRQIGGRSGIQPHPLKDKTVNSFLPSIAPGPLILPTKEAADTGSSSPHPATSMLGQASLKNEIAADIDFNDDIDTEIQRLYRNVDPSLISNETIDENAIALMEVPDLSEPTNHNRPPWIPTNIHELINQSSVADGEAFLPFLKKASGRQSIALSLSWATFAVSEKLPPLAQILDVETPLDSKYPELRASMMSNVDQLLQKCFISEQQTDSSDRVPPYLAILVGDRPLSGDDPFKQPSLLLLGRLERQRLNGKHNIEHVYDSDEPDGVGVGLTSPHNSNKRLRYAISPVKSPGDSALDDAPPPVEPLQPLDQDVTSGNTEPAEPSFYHLDPPAFYDEEEKENWDPMLGSSEYAFNQFAEDIVDIAANGFVYPLHYDNAELTTEIESFQLAEPDFFMAEDPNFGYSVEQLDGQAILSSNHQGSQASRDSVHEHELSFDPLQAEKGLFSHSLGILDFACLRSVKLSEKMDVERNAQAQLGDLPSVEEPEEPRKMTVPPEIVDKHTVTVEGASAYHPSTTHRYLASLDVLQKRALVKLLRTPSCLVDLIERTALDGVHLILDCSTALIFIPLLTLPSESAAWIDLVSSHSWKYPWLYIIFEAYPESCAYRSQERPSELHAYTAPILKAIKKFRRDIALAEAYNSKSTGCQVRFAFADSVLDAARLVRHIGHLAEDRDITGGAIWSGNREWLEYEHEDERDLATVEVLNRFSSALILSQVRLEDFLGMSSQDRLEKFGSYIGMDVVEVFNADIDSRFQRSSEADQTDDDMIM